MSVTWRLANVLFFQFCLRDVRNEELKDPSGGMVLGSAEPKDFGEAAVTLLNGTDRKKVSLCADRLRAQILWLNQAIGRGGESRNILSLHSTGHLPFLRQQVSGKSCREAT